MECRILASGLRFPEGPVVDGSGAIWGVELQGAGLFRWDAAGLERLPVGGAPNGLALHDGALWFCDADRGSIRCRAPDGAIVDCATSTPARLFDRPNDLAFDPVGTLVFTCPGNSRSAPTGRVWATRSDGEIVAVATDMLFPNGLAFTPDGSELIVAETYAHRLWRGRWDAHATRWIDPQPWLGVGGPIGPDGMAFAADGTLYVAIFGQGRVAVIDPRGAVESIAVPGSRPTNVALDPGGRHGLIVTEAEHGQLLSFPAIRGTPVLFSRHNADPFFEK